MFRSIMVLVLGLTMFAAPARAQGPRLSPEAGRHAYRYDMVQRNPGYPDAGYRLDFDLLSDGKGGLIAIVIGAFDTDSGKPVPASISEKCRAELHGQPGELARVTLSPRPAVAVERLDASFMAECAPAELFFPITDVLNISRAQMFPGLSGLKRPGDRVQAPGFATWLDRSGASVDESSPGAAIRFVALTPDRATIDWLPKPMAVTVTTHGGAGNSDSVLSGFEDIGYRLEIDPRTGVLLGAVTTHDRIDLTLSLPDGRKVPLNLTRDVVIAPRKDS